MPESTVASTRVGPGRVLIAVYTVFAIAATSRSAVQIATDFGRAPLAYALSAVAAVIYLVATVTLTRGSRRARAIAFVSCCVELTGVLTVGTASLVVPAAFPDATVWSAFGDGYLFIPVVLPVIGLWWLRRTRPDH
jgi:cytochrome bd-type quinol oxidase subunit 2